MDFNEQRLHIARTLAHQRGVTWGGLTLVERDALMWVAELAVRHAGAVFDDTATSSQAVSLTTVNYPDAEMRVRTHVSTGIDPKTCPGVVIDVIWPTAIPLPIYHQPGNVRLPFGVIDRDQVRSLHTLLADFLVAFPHD